MYKLLSGATAVGASVAVSVGGQRHIVDHTVQAEFVSRAATKISAVTLKLQGSLTSRDDDDAVVSDPAIAIGSTAERVANGAFNYRLAGTNYSKAAVAAGSVFTAAHVVSATKYGVVLLYVDSSGNISSTVPAATQAYATAELAHVAGDAIQTSGHGTVYIGRILINADAGDWTANTDDMTDASDLTTATFISATPDFFDIASHTFTAEEITAQKAMFHVTAKSVKSVRVYLSTLTGTGTVDVYYMGREA